MNQEVQKVIDTLPIIRQIYKDNAFITVMDENAIVQGFSIPDGVPPQMKIGQKFVDPSGAYDEVMRTGTKKYNYLPKEVMGEAFEGVLVPIKDGGSIVGCIICSYSVGVKERMTEITEQFNSSVSNVNESIQSIIAGIEDLSNSLAAMTDMTSDVESDVNNATNVVGKISSNASRSNILALNASIEAARSGEYGRGFAVVATEMGKLAKDSGSSAVEIKDRLNAIQKHLDSIVDSIKDANEMAKSHMESIGEIQGVLEETIRLANELEADIKVRG